MSGRLRRRYHRLLFTYPPAYRFEAAFAMLAGVAPIEASSGRVVRHRLNRGGTGS
jgi:transposase